MMDLKEIQKNWNEFGKKDPFWAILTDPTKKDNLWNVNTFFKTGEAEILSVLNHIHSLNISFSRERGLDFGCGVGRLTQALCRHFNHCYGVDIAPSMINLAKKYNRYGERCKYYLNETPDLTLFEDNTFDFIYSSIVLQHMKPEYSKHYIKEFLRVLAPGGMLVFQIPSELIPPQIQESGTQNRNKYGLPVSAFKAQITISEPSVKAEAGVQSVVLVKVKNISDVTWPALGAPDGKYQIKLGNHWLNDSGSLLVQDDGRTCLRNDLKPMEETTLSLMITTPKEPGNYILELDMVQETVAWFEVKRSETIRIGYQVLEGQRKAFGQRAEAQSVVKSVQPRGENYEGQKYPVYRTSKSRLGSSFTGWGIRPHFRRIFNRYHKNVPTGLPEPKMEMYSVRKDNVLNLIRERGGNIIDVKEDDRAGKDWLSFTYYVSKETRTNK